MDLTKNTKIEEFKNLMNKFNFTEFDKYVTLNFINDLESMKPIESIDYFKKKSIALFLDNNIFSKNDIIVNDSGGSGIVKYMEEFNTIIVDMINGNFKVNDFLRNENSDESTFMKSRINSIFEKEEQFKFLFCHYKRNDNGETNG